MLSPIPKARYSPSSSRPPMSRIITVRCHCCGPSDECSPNCATSSPIASIADQSCWTQSPSWAGGRSRSSPDPRPSGPSSQSLDDGSSNAPSLGSDATVALPRISRQASPAPRRGSWWQASACSLAASQGLETTGIILSQTLGSRRRLILEVDRFEAVLGDAKRHRSAVVIASPDRQRASGADLLQQAGPHQLSDSLSGGFALNVCRQFNTTIIALRSSG